MNNIFESKKLNNSYLAIRHGESIANEKRKIISDIKRGKSSKYGLTKTGEKQILEATKELIKLSIDPKKLIIASSPFSRCLESAKIFKNKLNPYHEIIIEDNLRERYFGKFNGKDESSYETIWEYDQNDPSHNNHGVESIDEIKERLIELIKHLEIAYHNKTILIISHGDIVKVLLHLFNNKKIEKNINNGEIKKLTKMSK